MTTVRGHTYHLGEQLLKVSGLRHYLSDSDIPPSSRVHKAL